MMGVVEYIEVYDRVAYRCNPVCDSSPTNQYVYLVNILDGLVLNVPGLLRILSKRGNRDKRRGCY
jgi:hypothetical protein